MFRTIASRLIASVATIIVAFVAMTGSASAAVEVNSADPSQLESVKGIGPSMSGKIVAARKQGSFKDWSDLETRVSGIGDKSAARLSRAGLTVGGRAKEGAPASPDADRAAKTTSRGSKKTVADSGNTAIASSAKK